MHSYRLRAAIFLIVLLAQTAPAQVFLPREQLRLVVDVARFRGSDDQQSMVELYYAFPRLALTYKADSAGVAGAGDITVWVRQRDSVVQADRWLVPHRIQDTTQGALGTNLVGVHTFQVPRGDYQIKVLVRDRHDPQRKDSLMLRLPVKVHGTAGPELSDIELAASIRQGAEAGTFYKNTLEVVPNVGGMYSADQRVFYYGEAYNLLSGEDRSDYSTQADRSGCHREGGPLAGTDPQTRGRILRDRGPVLRLRAAQRHVPAHPGPHGLFQADTGIHRAEVLRLQPETGGGFVAPVGQLPAPHDGVSRDGRGRTGPRIALAPVGGVGGGKEPIQAP